MLKAELICYPLYLCLFLYKQARSYLINHTLPYCYYPSLFLRRAHAYGREERYKIKQILKNKIPTQLSYILER